MKDDAATAGAPTLRLLGAVLAAVLILAPWWLAREEARKSFPGFLPVRPPFPAEAKPYFATCEINPLSNERKAHSAALAELPDGSLVAAWYAGSGEGAKDVTIQVSHAGHDGVWSEPRAIFDRQSVSQALHRHVLSLGNPLLLAGDTGDLALLFVSISAGKWSGSSINYASSPDAGRTWTAPRKLTLNPLANLSALPRNPPAPLVGGGWAVPIYEEFLGRFPELLWIRPRDPVETAAVSRMAGGMVVFQPSVVPSSRDFAMAFYRNDSGAGRVFLSQSTDRGRSWSEGAPSTLPNVDSGVCALWLPDGRLLCAINDSTTRKRENLRLALSEDGGRSWRIVATLAEEAGENFAYPYMILGREGLVKMLYSARDNRIVYVAFNTAWLDAQAAAGGSAR